MNVHLKWKHITSEEDEDGYCSFEEREEYFLIPWRIFSHAEELNLPASLSDAKVLLSSYDAVDEAGELLSACAHVAARATHVIASSTYVKRNGAVGCPSDQLALTPEAVPEAEEKLRELRERVSFLRSVGIYASVQAEEAWSRLEEDRDTWVLRAELWAVAPLSATVDGDDPFYDLAELIGDGSTDQDENAQLSIPLGAFAGKLRSEMEGNSGALPDLPPISAKQLAELAEEWRDAGYDWGTFQATGARRLARSPESIEAIVPGLIFRGKVHLLLAAAGAGKSTLAHELAFKLGARQRPGSGPLTWCGQPLRRAAKPGVIRFFSGEDAADIVAARDRALAGAGVGDNGLTVIPANRDKLMEFVRRFRGAKRGEPGVPDLVIIDPARTFLDGNEDQSENVGSWLGELVELAAGTGAAVLVLHHLAKNVRPHSLEEVKRACRGSGVWIDRPRVVIGMYRSSGVTRIGVCKTNIPGVKSGETIALAYDPATGQHHPRPSAGAEKSSTPPATSAPAGGDQSETAEQVLAALVRLAGEGKRVTRSGKRDGLFELKPEELAGMTRVQVRDALDALAGAGRITMEDGGLYPADAEAGLADAAE